MNNEDLRLYRAKLFRDASSLERKPDRIPHMSFFVTWKILDAGYRLSEAMNDYEIMEKVVAGRTPHRCPCLSTFFSSPL